MHPSLKQMLSPQGQTRTTLNTSAQNQLTSPDPILLFYITCKYGIKHGKTAFLTESFVRSSSVI